MKIQKIINDKGSYVLHQFTDDFYGEPIVCEVYCGTISLSQNGGEPINVESGAIEMLIKMLRKAKKASEGGEDNE